MTLPETALGNNVKADALDRDRRSVGEPQARAGFIGSRLQIYQFAAMELLDQKRYAEAFDMTERSRSRVLSDMIASRPPDFADARTQALFVKAATLRQRIAAEQAAAFEATGAPTHGDPAAAHADEALRADEAAYDRMLARMAVEAPALAALVASRGADMAALQRAMRDDGFEVLQYMLTPLDLVIWHLGANGHRLLAAGAVARSDSRGIRSGGVSPRTKRRIAAPARVGKRSSRERAQLAAGRP